MSDHHHKQPHLLEVEHIHVHYGTVCALRNVTFKIGCGNVMALIGANGSGKSTLLKSIVGLIQPSEGRVLWRGKAVKRSTSEMAYLPQRELLDWDFPLTVRGLVEMGRYPLLGPWKPFGKADHQAVDEAMEAMEIAALQNRHISALSGGQQQRAFIARALAQQPHVLLLDEPLNGLDQPAQETLINLICKLADNGSLVIASHHDVHSARGIFDSVLLLKRQPVAFGPVADTLTDANLTETFT